MKKRVSDRQEKIATIKSLLKGSGSDNTLRKTDSVFVSFGDDERTEEFVDGKPTGKSFNTESERLEYIEKNNVSVWPRDGHEIVY